MYIDKKEVREFADKLCVIQANMQKKALSKDASIVIDVFELDEIINELKVLVSE